MARQRKTWKQAESKTLNKTTIPVSSTDRLFSVRMVASQSEFVNCGEICRMVTTNGVETNATTNILAEVKLNTSAHYNAFFILGGNGGCRWEKAGDAGIMSGRFGCSLFVSGFHENREWRHFPEPDRVHAYPGNANSRGIDSGVRLVDRIDIVVAGFH